MSLENRLHQALWIGFAVVAGVLLLAWARSSRPAVPRFDRSGRARAAGTLRPGGKARYLVRGRPGQDLRVALEEGDVVVRVVAKGFWRDAPLARVTREEPVARALLVQGGLCLVRVEPRAGAADYSLALALSDAAGQDDA